MSNNRNKASPLVLLPYCAQDTNEMKRIAEDKGLAVEVIEDEDIIPQMIKKYSPSDVLGVACPEKVESVGIFLDSINQPYKAIPLECEVCFKITGDKARVDMQLYKTEIDKLI